MKYIFVVHSPITYLASLGVIYKEKLNTTDTIIISETFGLDNEPFPIFKLLKPKKKGKYQTYFSPSIQNKLYKLINQEFNDEPFTAFIPVFHYLERFLVVHDNCKEFHFIEEGLAAYYSAYSMKQQMLIPGGNIIYSKKLLNKSKEILGQIVSVCKGYTGKLNAIPTFYLAYAQDKNINFYGFSSFSHKFALNKKIISFDDIAKNYDFRATLNLKDCYIWINDPDIQIISNYTTDEFLDVIRNGYINFLKKKNITFSYIRFHYRDNSEQREILIDLFKSEGIEVIVIPDKYIMEIELMNSRNVCLYGFYSSLLLYGSILGCKCYSIINYSVYSKTNSLNSRIESFWNFVERV